ncbi:hypothetical protein KZ307_25630, partial [Escherichia coli]|nr:hypothetical protein [Escherichia coli]
PHRIVEFAHAARPSDFGTLTPLVFDYAARNDAVALAIVNRAAAQIEEGLDAIMPSAQERLSLIGGLGPLFEQRLSPPY